MGVQEPVVSPAYLGVFGQSCWPKLAEAAPEFSTLPDWQPGGIADAHASR